MFCKHCGYEITQADAEFCPSCGKAVKEETVRSQIQNKQETINLSSGLVGSILVTLFCCNIFGVVSLIHSAKVATLASLNRADEAIQEAKTAKKWMWLAFGLGLAGYLVIFAIAIVLFAFGVNQVEHRFDSDGIVYDEMEVEEEECGNDVIVLEESQIVQETQVPQNGASSEQ